MKLGQYRVGCDIGGTFTDFVVLDVPTGTLSLEKRLTTADDPSRGVLEGVADLGSRLLGLAGATEIFIHGTTLVINLIVERKGSSTALITTHGFRDVLEMRNEQRYDKYNLFQEYPEPLVPRHLRIGLQERTHASGRALRSIDTDEVRHVARRLVGEGVESVAVAFLHAYANPAHEEQTARILAETAPSIAVSLSHQVLPKIKEYDRFSTTVANAYVKPLVKRYLEALEFGLRKAGYDGRMYLMNSHGGLTTTATARELPVRIVESGPAGGVIASRFYGQLVGERDLLSFDMGGTTAKACLIRDGVIATTSQYEVARMHRFKPGSGLPLYVPTVDMVEIGAGGGSIAFRNRLGLVQVGPTSAGAHPGPACYDAGGTEPTITDVDLLLGYLSSDYFLGGRMSLNAHAARSAVQDRLARPLDTAPEVVIWGVHELANQYMASAIKSYLLERGQDPAVLSMVAYGGAGPVHAYGVARKVGIRRVLVPPAAGVMSALGFLMASPALEFTRTYKAPLKELDPHAIKRVFALMREEAAELLSGSSEPILYRMGADMRYIGQGYEIDVPLSGERLTDLSFTNLQAAFEARYRTLYERTNINAEVELINLRLLAALPRLSYTPAPILAGADPVAALKHYRPVRFDSDGIVPCPVYERSRLPAGVQIKGPAIVEEAECTTVCGPHGSVKVDHYGILHMEIGL